MRKYLLLGILLAIFIPFFAVKAQTPDQVIFALTNKLRAQNNLPLLHRNTMLDEAAREKAEAIFKTQSFEHNLPGNDFYEFVDRTGYRYKSLGENLAIDLNDPKIVVEKWMASPTHRNNLLDPQHKDIGIAVKTDTVNGITTTVSVQLMARPKLLNLSTPLISFLTIFVVTIGLGKLATYSAKIYK